MVTLGIHRNFWPSWRASWRVPTRFRSSVHLCKTLSLKTNFMGRLRVGWVGWLGWVGWFQKVSVVWFYINLHRSTLVVCDSNVYINRIYIVVYIYRLWTINMGSSDLDLLTVHESNSHPAAFWGLTRWPLDTVQTAPLTSVATWSSSQMLDRSLAKSAMIPQYSHANWPELGELVSAYLGLLMFVALRDKWIQMDTNGTNGTRCTFTGTLVSIEAYLHNLTYINGFLMLFESFQLLHSSEEVAFAHKQVPLWPPSAELFVQSGVHELIHTQRLRMRRWNFEAEHVCKPWPVLITSDYYRSTITTSRRRDSLQAWKQLIGRYERRIEALSKLLPYPAISIFLGTDTSVWCDLQCQLRLPELQLISVRRCSEFFKS